MHLSGRSSVWDIIWPNIETRKQAVAIARRAIWKSILVLTMTAVLVLLSLTGTNSFGVDAWSSVGVTLFMIVAWGISRMSCSVTAIFYYLCIHFSIALIYPKHRLFMRSSSSFA